ncbi:Inositol 2-dehydrogenase/D-chiro-inositol 3-dehydrogenase [subsurface metagenome]
MKNVTRRDFVKSTFAAGCAAVLPGCAAVLPYSRVQGANDRIRVGLVGCGGRGKGAHIPSFEKQEGVTVVALSDPDRQRMAEAAKMVESKYGHRVEQYVDMRKMFDRKDVDVIANATQNYWHGLSTIWACQAGKHVYVEKPLSHYIWEGRQMVNAARKYNRIVQCGTQRRSQSSIAKAIQWIREGNLGRLRYITAFANKPRFPTAPLLYEVHNLRKARDSDEMPAFRGEGVGVIVDCEGGSVSLYRGMAWDNEGKQVKTFSGGGDHFVNFIEAVRSGRREDLNADVLEGHISTAVSHTGNISYRLGVKASRKEMHARVRDIPIFTDMFDRLLEHLAAHEINIDARTVTLGPWLKIDRENECFRNNEQANRLVRGFYREPYVVPDLSG